MTIRLSHSAKDKMTTCGAYYKNHYIERVRSIELGSALVFGSALDDAFGCLLMQKKKQLTDEEKTMFDKGALQVFLEGMDSMEYNGETIAVSDYPHMVYFKSDYDPRFNETIYPKILEKFELEHIDLDDFMSNALSKNAKLNKDEILIKNYTCWLSLIEKGKMMIEQYDKEVIPKIEEVIDIQRKVELPNDNGDVIIGYIDFIASFNDEPGVVYIVDNKTSSKAYKKDSVVTSEQLATYCYYEDTNKGAYVVVEKVLRKREPKVKISIIKDTIPEKQFDKTLDLYLESLYNITQNEFEYNFDSGCFMFGRKCPYYNYCRTDGNNMSGLVKLKERK